MLEYATFRLDFGNYIHEFREESAPDITGGPASYQDVLYGLDRLITEGASWAEVGLVNREPFICKEVTGEKFHVEAEFLGILSCKNVVESWMSSPCQATYLYIQVFHLGIG